MIKAIMAGLLRRQYSGAMRGVSKLVQVQLTVQLIDYIIIQPPQAIGFFLKTSHTEVTGKTRSIWEPTWSKGMVIYIYIYIYIYVYRFFLDFESIGSQQCILCLLIRPTTSSLFRADVSYIRIPTQKLVLTLTQTLILTLNLPNSYDNALFKK